MKKPHRVFVMPRPRAKLRPIYLILSLVFALGAGIGYLAAGRITDLQHQELSDYLRSYMQCAASARTPPVAGVIFAYFREPLALLLAGFFVGGVWLVPLMILGQGFLLAFSVSCFSLALGRTGLLCAFAAFGIRCLFVLPCSFFLAAQAWFAADRLRHGERLKSELWPKVSPLYAFFACSIALLLGCVIEISLVPRLFMQILIHIPQ